MCVCICVAVHRGQRSTSFVFLSHSLSSILRQDLSWDFELSDLTGMAGQSVPGNPLASVFSEWGLQMSADTPGFLCGSWESELVW